MESRSGKLSCIFNGEIYNHLELRKKFFPEINGEEQVIQNHHRIIDKFGIKSLQLIEGMYSGYTIKSKYTFLFRDRAGENLSTSI